MNVANLKDKLNEDQLDLSLCSLESVPVKEIAELPRARKLNLSFNSLTRLPEDFIKLQNIINLDLSKNQLTTLPKNFGQLSNLKYLDLLGNKLVGLPTSFCELKSLIWLDLKDNPTLPIQLQQAAGDCFDEVQCKKCATNVLRYMKAVASEEERQRQIELKRKREEQAKREMAEREKENQLREIKKLEKEKRRVANEQRKNEASQQSDSSATSADQDPRAADKAKLNERKSRLHSRLLTLFFTIGLAFVLFNVFLSNYCDKATRSHIFKSDLLKHESLVPVFDSIERDACPRWKQFNQKYLISNWVELKKYFDSVINKK